MSAMVETEVSPPHRYNDGHKKKRARPRHPGAGTMWRRLRDNWSDIMKIGADPNLGTVVGKLYLFGVITETEATAARRYAEVVGRHDRYMGMPRRQVASPAYERGFGAEDEIAKRERQGTISAYERRARRAKREMVRLRSQIPNDTALTAVESVCVLDQEIPTAQHADLKTLLNKMAKVYGAREQSERPERAPLLKVVDTVLAQVVNWFYGEKSKITAFRVRTDFKDSVGITCFGPGADGEINHTAVVKVGKIMPEAFAAAFLKAAERMGWEERT
jgi:hypothetical protein